MRRRNLYIAAGAAAVLVAWVGWKVVGGGGGGSSADTGGGAAAGDPDSPAARRMRGGGGAGGLGRVQGTVRGIDDRKPVAGVDVTFGNAFGESTATSGADGRYTLSLGPGGYRVVAIGDGVLGAAGSRFELRPGQQVEGYDILVSRLVAVRGSVIDHRGAAVAGAHVTYSARLGGKPIGSAQTAPVGEATSDDGGGFEMEVPAGDVKLIAEIGEARGESLVSGLVPDQVPPAVIIRLAAGSAVAGRVVDSARAPVAGAEVVITVVGGDGPVGDRSATSDTSGGFRFDHLAPGTATLEARAPSGVSPPMNVALADGQDRTGIELVLAGAATIKGRVVDGKGKPVSGAAVMARPGNSKIKLRTVTSSSDGAFVLEGLAAGTQHAVQARHEGYANAFVRNVVPPADKVEVVLLSAGGVRGVVKVAKGAPPASFQVRAERFVEADGVVRPGAASSRFSSSDGRFELDLVNPGQYDLVVTADGFAPVRPPRVAVPPDGWAEIEVELAAAATVSGTVSSAGAPVAGARVAMSSGYEGPPVFTDAQGRFTLIDVAPGRRSISASKSGMVSAHRDDVAVRAGETVAVELTLGAAGNKKEGGIGLVLASTTQTRPRIAAVARRGPAFKAGVARGDLLLAVDGITTLNMPVDRATALLRGPVGATVRVEVERAGKLLRFDVARAPD